MKSIFLCLLLSLNVFAQDELTIVAVGEAELEKIKISIADPEYKGTFKGPKKSQVIELIELIRNDFAFYRHKLQVFGYDKIHGDPMQSANYEKWKLKEYDYVIGSETSIDGGTVKFKVKLHHVIKGEELFEKEYEVPKSRLREIGHQISNDLYKKVFGKESIFMTKIIFVSDKATKNRRRNLIKELYIMDFDGRNVERLTYLNGNVISPAISPDKEKVIYSYVSNTKIKKRRNINLFVMDLKTRRSKLISNRSGLNSGAAFTSDGKEILLTLSHTGNSDIYRMNLGSNKVRRLTTHYSDDVDPSLNADGSLMSFLSGRSGRAHIYTMDPSAPEKNVKRISFVGRFNATPRFSPDGREIVFSSWVDNRFDIYRIGSNGNNLVRLTKNFGSNEEPMFSKDGEFIIFTSQRVLSAKKAIQDIYVMNKDGEILGQLTKNFGNVSAPRWSN
jgi:TolB protein